MDTTTVLIIGSGFGGQVTAINLLRRGITDFRILERRDFMGGTWCQNSYPGAAVDVPSPLYSIASEPYPWTRMYAEQAELRDYTEHVIDRHRLRERTVLGAEVVGAEWDGEAWNVRTERRRRPPRPLPGQRLRPAQHAGRAALRRARRLRGPRLPHQRLGPRRRPGRQAGRRHRLGRQRGAGDPRDPARGGRAARVPAQPPLGAPPPRPGLHPAPAAALRLRPLQRALRTAIYWKLRDPGHRLQAQPLAAEAHRPARGAGAHRRPGAATRSCARSSPPTTRSAASGSSCPTPSTPPWARPTRRSTTATTASPTSTRPASSPRAGSTSTSTSSSSPPATTPPTASSRTTSAGATASRWRTSGTSSPAPTSARPSPASPTSSSSPAPTPASATPARSS